jgi:hypothetical protein
MDSLKKLDAVAANKIWYERLKTEQKCIKINEEFRINPKLLKQNRMVSQRSFSHVSFTASLIYYVLL